MSSQTISASDLGVIRAIANAGFTYSSAKELAAAAHWELDQDEPSLGYLRFNVGLIAGEPPLSLVVEFGMDDRPAFAFIGLYGVPERDQHEAEFAAYFNAADQALQRSLGTPTSAGTYGYPHRTWLYNYSWWSLTDASLALVQDEFDIQSGFDVTLWVFRPGTPKRMPVSP